MQFDFHYPQVAIIILLKLILANLLEGIPHVSINFYREKTETKTKRERDVLRCNIIEIV